MNVNALTDLIITKVYLASTIYSPKNKSAKRTNRPRWAIIMKYEGETVYTSCGEKFLSDYNHIIVLPKGCSYEWQCNREGHFSVVEFESELSLQEPLSFYLKNSEKILKALKELEYKRNTKQPMFEFESIRDVYSILISLAKSESEKYLPSEKYNKIAPAIEYISKNYNKKITNAELAEVTGTSVVYFRKLFSDVMGTSPIAYAQKIRVEMAAEMLKSDFGTISDVSASLGYSSLYDFSRAFKKHVGISPSKYLKK